MAGNMRFLDKDGNVVSGAMAMGLTTAVSGVDYAGGGIFYATDTLRLYKLSYSNGALKVISSIRVENQVVGGTEVHAITTNGSGHWIAIEKIITGNPSSVLTNIHRFTLDGTWLYQLAGFNIGVLGNPDIDLTHDGMYLYANSHASTAGGFTQKWDKLYFDKGTKVRPTKTTTANGLRFTSFCFQGKDFYVMKGNNFNLAITRYKNFTQVENLGAPGTRSDAICLIKGIGAQSGLDPFEDAGVGYDDHQILSGAAIVAHVT
jgi:hypothetical protein